METPEKKKKKSKLIPVILVLVIGAAAAFGISRYVYSLHHEVTDDAQVDSDMSPVIVRVSGYVRDILFIENTYVHKGDTLVILDDRDFKIKEEQAEAAVANAESAVLVARANVSTARANFETATSNVTNAQVRVWKADKDFERYKNLLEQNVGTQQQFDASKAEKESAAAQLQVALKQQQAAGDQVTAADQQVQVAGSMVKQRKADLDFASLQLSYTTITAPISGMASQKNIMTGQFVNAGAPLFAIVASDDLYVTANFKETQLSDMKVGQPVKITADAFPDSVLNGHISIFSAATGAKFSLLPPDNATGNFVKVVQRIPVKIELDLSPEMKLKLRSGMSVKVAVSTNS